MQYNVPQFVDVEDKIIGPLTLKQFLILVAGALLGFFYWSIFKTGALFFLLFLPTAGIFAFLAFGKFNGRPVMSSFILVAHFFITPRYRVFKRVNSATVVIKKKSQLEEKAEAADDLDPLKRTSRLHRLAYLLDQKSAETEKLVHQTSEDLINN